MCLSGNGWKPFNLRKSNTLMPYNSDTRHGWLRKSKYSVRWIHLLGSLATLRNKQDPLSINRVILLERLEHANLNLARVAILLYCSNDLDGHLLPRLDVTRLDDLAKRALAEEANDFVCRQPMSLPSLAAYIARQSHRRA